MCDNYLEMASELKCESNDYFIKHGFEMCSRLYKKAISRYDHLYSAMLICTEGCIQQTISSSINEGEKSCPVISQQAFGNYSVCFAKCGGCFLPKSWDLIYDMFENLSINLIGEFAEQCAREFREATNSEFSSSLDKIAKSFIDLAKEKKRVDVSHHFTEFTTTTTSQPTSLTTEKSKSTTLNMEFTTTTSQPTSLTTEKSKSTTLKTSGNQNDMYNTGYVCEFRSNIFNISCLRLSLIIVSILILIVIVCVYESALKSSQHRSGQGPIVEMTPLANNR
jgi:hypothetical protein